MSLIFDCCVFVVACLLIILCFRLRQKITKRNIVYIYKDDDEDWDIEPSRGEWEEGDMFLEDDEWSDSE